MYMYILYHYRYVYCILVIIQDPGVESKYPRISSDAELFTSDGNVCICTYIYQSRDDMWVCMDQH